MGLLAVFLYAFISYLYSKGIKLKDLCPILIQDLEI